MLEAQLREAKGLLETAVDASESLRTTAHPKFGTANWYKVMLTTAWYDKAKALVESLDDKNDQEPEDAIVAWATPTGRHRSCDCPSCERLMEYANGILERNERQD